MSSVTTTSQKSPVNPNTTVTGSPPENSTSVSPSTQLGSPPTTNNTSAAAAPPTPQEIQRKLSVASRSPKGKNRAPITHSGTDTEDESNSILQPETALPAAPSTALGASGAAAKGLSSIAEKPLSGGEESDEDEDEIDGGWRVSTNSGLTGSGGGTSGNQNPFATKELEVLHSGYLWKKGSRRKTWKKRWFVLRTKHLAYYKTSAEYKLLRLLDLSDIHAVTPVTLKRHAHTLGIVTQARIFYLEAETSEQIEKWVQKLNEAKDALQSVTSIGSGANGTGKSIPIPSIGVIGSAGNSASGGGLSASANNTTTNTIQPTSSSSNTKLSTTSGAATSTSPTVPPSPKVVAFSEPLVPPVISSSSPQSQQREQITQHQQQVQQAQQQAVQAQASAPGSGSGGIGSATTGKKATVAAAGGPARVQPAMSVQVSGLGASTSAGEPRSPNLVLSGNETSDSEVEGPSGVTGNRGSTSTSLSSGKIIASGYLMKYGSRRRNWRKRWFVLTPEKLVYAGSHMDTKMHRQIPLSTILDAMECKPSKLPVTGGGELSNNDTPGSPLVVGGGSANVGTHGHGGEDGQEGIGGGKFTFKVITPKKTLMLCAPTEEEEVKWIGAVRALIARRTEGVAAGTSTSAAGGDSGLSGGEKKTKSERRKSGQQLVSPVAIAG